MADIWTELPAGGAGSGDARWGVVSLDASTDALWLTGDPMRPVAPLVGSPTAGGAYLMRHNRQGGGATWTLYAGPAAKIAVNGTSLPMGMRTLRDRDSITIDGVCHMVYTAASTPRVRPFPLIPPDDDNDTKVFCPRCGDPLETDQLAVLCPHCGVWHHEDASIERECWTYGPTCVGCDTQGTTLDGEPAWTPEDL